MNRRGHHWGATVPQGGRVCALLLSRLPAWSGFILRFRRLSSTRIRIRRRELTDSTILVSSLVCSAFLMAVAVGSRGHPWVGWVGLLPIFLAIRSLTPSRALLCGALWGLCLHLFLVSSDTSAIFPTTGSLVFLVLIPAVYAYLGARLTRRIGFSPLFLALGWVGVEFALRPLGLGFGMLATTQENGGILQVVGGPLGYLFVAFLIALINAKLLSIVSNARFRRARSSILLYSDYPQAWLLTRSFRRFLILTADSYRPRAPPIGAMAIG